MSDMPEDLQLAPSSEREVTFLVPKFHLPAHIMACQSSFSFNYTRGVGRTDGEAQSEVDRKDFASPPQNCCSDLREQIESHHDFEKRLGSKIVEPWRRDVEKWEADPTADNPFSAVVNKLRSSRIESPRRAVVGKGRARTVPRTRHSLCSHIDGSGPRGATVSRVQCSIAFPTKRYPRRSLAHDTANLGMHATDRQRLMLVQKANIVRNKVNVWIDHQKLYCPSASALRTGESNSPTDPIAAVPMINLWLPSSIGSRATCPKLLREIEWQLRHAQANDALHDIRANLQIRVGVFQQKDRFERGQRAMTRSRSVLARLQDKIDECTERYRVAVVLLWRSHPSSTKPLKTGPIRSASYEMGTSAQFRRRDERDGGQTNNIMDLAGGWSGATAGKARPANGKSALKLEAAVTPTYNEEHLRMPNDRPAFVAH
ncbi:CxC2 domain-containing protein [Salix suchowensis]|nr:CxC2 domain-containing protein [Salix suchowensis]